MVGRKEREGKGIDEGEEELEGKGWEGKKMCRTGDDNERAVYKNREDRIETCKCMGKERGECEKWD